MPSLSCNYAFHIAVICMALSYGTCLVVIMMHAFGVSRRCALQNVLQNVWTLSINTHGNLIYTLSCVRPIEVELKCRVFNFFLKMYKFRCWPCSFRYTTYYFFIGLLIADW